MERSGKSTRACRAAASALVAVALTIGLVQPAGALDRSDSAAPAPLAGPGSALAGWVGTQEIDDPGPAGEHGTVARAAVEPLVRAAGQSQSWCLGDDFGSDPIGDPGPDLATYSVSEVCNLASTTVVARVRTMRRASFVEVLIDSDRDEATGCGGIDWGYAKTGVTVFLVQLPSCDIETWVEVTQFRATYSNTTYSEFRMDASLVRGSSWLILVGDFAENTVDQSWTSYYASTDTVECNSHAFPVASAAGSDGYWLAGVDGSIWGMGSASDTGHACRNGLGAARVTDFEQISWQSGDELLHGWLMLHADGLLVSKLQTPIGKVVEPWGVGAMEAVAVMPAGSRTPNTEGLWVAYDNGAVVPTNHWDLTPREPDAPAGLGDLRDIQLSAPIIDAVSVGDGAGYWLIGADGGVFAVGSAQFYGSTGALILNEPVVGMVADPDGQGYWLVAADGGVFAFDAPYRGSVPAVLPPGTALNSPIVGMTAYGNGYLMFAADGGVFNFSDRAFVGSLGDSPPVAPIIGVAALPTS